MEGKTGAHCIALYTEGTTGTRIVYRLQRVERLFCRQFLYYHGFSLEQIGFSIFYDLVNLYALQYLACTDFLLYLHELHTVCTTCRAYIVLYVWQSLFAGRSQLVKGGVASSCTNRAPAESIPSFISGCSITRHARLILAGPVQDIRSHCIWRFASRVGSVQYSNILSTQIGPASSLLLVLFT